MNEKQTLAVLALIAAAGTLAGIHNLRLLLRANRRNAEIAAITAKQRAAFFAAAKRVEEAIKNGEFKPNSVVEIEEAFNFEVSIALSE